MLLISGGGVSRILLLVKFVRACLVRCVCMCFLYCIAFAGCGIEFSILL